MRKAMVLGAMTLAGALASPAFADEFSGFRLGVLISQDKQDGFYNHSLVNPPSSVTTKSDSDRMGYELFGGWGLNKWLAAEVGYHDGTQFTKNVFPEFVESLDTSDPTTCSCNTKGSEFYKLSQDIKSFDASVVGSLWISNKFAVFGRAGFVAWRGEVSYAFGDSEPGPTVPVTPPFKFRSHARDDGFAPLFGVGIQSQLDHALIRLEYQYADIGDVAFGTDSFGETFSSTDNTYSSLAFSIVWIL
jgi:opacity protein-like surface antigen